MDSKREQIVQKIITRMQGILTTSGYQTDLGENVRDWETNWDAAELPALSVCDLIDAHTLANNQPSATVQTNKLTVQLRIFCKSDTRASSLRKMMADINKAIKIDSAWDGLAMWTIPIKSGIIIHEQSFEIGGAAVEIEIHYLTNAFDAYQ